VGGQGTSGPPKLRVERQPFLAFKVVIFGVNPTGPHILVVIEVENSSPQLEDLKRSSEQRDFENSKSILIPIGDSCIFLFQIIISEKIY
jgi:hypothetical protein